MKVRFAIMLAWSTVITAQAQQLSHPFTSFISVPMASTTPGFQFIGFWCKDGVPQLNGKLRNRTGIAWADVRFKLFAKSKTARKDLDFWVWLVEDDSKIEADLYKPIDALLFAGFRTCDSIESIELTVVDGRNESEKRAKEAAQRAIVEARDKATRERIEEAIKAAEEERKQAAIAEAAAEKRRDMARAAEAKRQADAAATRAKYLATLPSLDSGLAASFLGSDKKCSEQFLQALAMDGLEKRKKIAELVSYGCGVIVEGRPKITVTTRDGFYSRVTIANGGHAGKEGWVPNSWVKQ